MGVEYLKLLVINRGTTISNIQKVEQVAVVKGYSKATCHFSIFTHSKRFRYTNIQPVKHNYSSDARVKGVISFSTIIISDVVISKKTKFTI